MSHPYGSNTSRTPHARRSEQDEHNKFHSGPSREATDNYPHSRGKGRSRGRGGGSGGRGHPSWLKGKNIGLYYRDKAREKSKKNETSVITLDKDVARQMQAALNSSKTTYDEDEVWNGAIKNGARSDYDDKYTHMNDSQFKRKFLNIISGDITANIEQSLKSNVGLKRNTCLDNSLLESWKMKQTTAEYKKMLSVRKKLPATEKRAEILKLINENQVVVISGETGCGKTTQVPQFVLDDQIETGNGSITKVICTQPRRISAISVAERVAAERAERLGESVGFHIRLEKKLAKEQGSIVYCTTGILLQFMQTNPALTNFSHLILDEIHERNIESDIIITLLKLVITKRPDLKVVLMSATLNSERFSEYYNNCPMIHIPGFTYPVKEYYLEDALLFTNFQFPAEISQPTSYRKHLKKYKSIQQKKDDFSDFIEPYIRELIAEKKYPKHVIDQLRNSNSENLSLDLIEQLIRYICKTNEPGAILVFLPGIMDIVKLHRLMLDSKRYPESLYVIYPLHSRMPTVDQKVIFNQPPLGMRKIIIATSIAETSITIEDVVHVIDCGKMKLSRFDVNSNIETLQAEWVTIANAKQRRGRAGRVGPGYCYHLYPKAKELVFDQYPVAEMLRTRLETLILQIKILQVGKVDRFLATVMDPPDKKAVSLSLDLLKTLNAIDNDDRLTPLGYHLAKLPLDPRTGKMIIWASLFSCVEPVFAIAASLGFKDAFYCPLGKEEEASRKKSELSMNEYSDHMALAEALRKFEIAYQRGNASYFCREYFLSFNTLKLLSEMRDQFAQHLCEMKFLSTNNIHDYDANRNSDNIALIKAVVCAGLYPNVATVKHVSKYVVRAWTPEDGAVQLHPSSVNAKVNSFPSPFLVYYTKQRSTAIFLHDTSCVTAPMLLFADPHNYRKYEKGRCTITLSTSQKLICNLQTAEIIEKLQQELSNLLEYKITNPETINWNTREGRILNAIVELVSLEDQKVGFRDFVCDNDDNSKI